ncbi:uncharacterized protein RAG0_07469 [Rhynchosporium agropyri]|uniref:PNPLA domain-containing protein n=1 Tax=Rhynchosporium agropyri TaxID=914238 RepID=A0A1E1KLN8_9HELO|nr:uncharacterized protein RAG0_07469 [Rhynchosporium agropyri]
MTVAPCLASYKKMTERAFTPVDEDTWKSYLPLLPGRPEGSFSGVALEEAVKEIVHQYTGDRDTLFADTTCCPTTVLAITKVDVSAAPTKFRTYDIGDDFKDIKIWEEIEFIDAGFGHNNPTEVVFSEAGYIFSDEPCDCVISIGTGHSDIVEITNSRLSILNALKKMASHSEAVHRRVSKMLPEEAYFRFNVIRSLEDITLSDWRQNSKISAHTSNYPREHFVEKAVRQCASILTQG